jgi:hypothetical protein
VFVICSIIIKPLKQPLIWNKILKKIQAVLFLNTPSRLIPNKECFLKFGVEVGVEESIRLKKDEFFRLGIKNTQKVRLDLNS